MNSEVVKMFTYLQTMYNTAAAAADSIRTQTAYLRVHQPSRATRKKKLTFFGAGVPDEHNDANPTHNVMNTHTHTHTLASVVQQSQKKLRPLQASLLLGIKVWDLRTLFDRDLSM